MATVSEPCSYCDSSGYLQRTTKRNNSLVKCVMCDGIGMKPVAPVAPDPGLREAIIKAIESAYTPHMAMVDEMVINLAVAADAVLAVLAERGVR